ncbi:MAG: hypothetical protein JXA71_20395 [Chitinispirillaceae bacterium]|nr:hypothetical protein [Chitinispirillaceae bacterium]
MMNNDDFNRAPQMQQGRKPFTPNRYGNSGGGYNYNNYSNQNSGFSGPQHPRRRADRFKRESLNVNDKIARQNDVIIKLLKEIRDRLPPPPPVSNETNDTAQKEQGDQIERIDVLEDQMAQQQDPAETAAEPGNENTGFQPD